MTTETPTVPPSFQEPPPPAQPAVPVEVARESKGTVDPYDMEWGTIVRKVKRKGRAIIGLLSGILVTAAGIMIVLVIIATSVTPLPDSSTSGFEWRQWVSGEGDSIRAGNYLFALMQDGNVAVVNLYTGEKTLTSAAITNGRGTSLSFDSNTGVLTVSTNTTEIAVVNPLDDASEDYRLVILPTGTVFIKDGEGKTTPITSSSFQPPPP